MSSATVPSKDLRHGHKNVTVTAARLTELDLYMYVGVVLKCPKTNTSSVWIGGEGVTANVNEGTGGMPLDPGENFTIPGDRVKEIWVVTDTGTQDIAYMVL